MKWLRRALVLVLCIIVFALALLAVNQEQVSLRFLDWQTPEVSLFWWLLIAFGTGVAFGLIATLVMTVRGAARTRALNKQIRVRDKELEALRTQAAAE